MFKTYDKANELKRMGCILMKSNFFLIVFIIVFIIVLQGFYSCDRSSTLEEPTTAIEGTPPLYVGENMRLTVYNSEVTPESPNLNSPMPDIIVRGDVDSTYDRTNTIVVNDLRVLYNNIDQETGELSQAQLTSDYGEVDYQTKDFEAWGNVVAIKDQDIRVETSRIKWDNSTQRLTSVPEEQVLIYRIDGTVTVGKNLVMDKELNIIELEEGLTQTPRTIDETSEEF